jgi:Transcriptional regulator containing an amidase domain and an AraC-type DNA-binding HTH domain
MDTLPGILQNLAQILGTEVKNRRLEIPEKFGKGYCIGYVFNKHIRLLISNYELFEDLEIKNPEFDISKRMLFFKFQNIFPKSRMEQVGKQISEISSVLIATSRINTDEIISIHSNTATINIEVDTDYLNELFDSSQQSPVLQSLILNTQPLLFEQLLHPSIQNIVNEILTEKIDESFELFFMRIKAEELVCRLLMELEKRNEKQFYSLNSRDIQTIYSIKEQMLDHLGTPPSINELAISANMSSSKLKRLFKQIFGNSIFNYYQEFRIKEAARLLKEEKLSISDVGYQLGFTNLSHFARVFKEHIGMKPKQYSQSQH